LPGGNWIKPTNKKFDDISVRTKSNKLVTVWGFDKDDRSMPFHSNDWDENKKPAPSVPPKPDEITKWNRKDFFVYRNPDQTFGYQRVCATSDGSVFFFRGNSVYLPFGVPSNTGSFVIRFNSKPDKAWRGFSVGKDNVYLCTQTKIYFFPRNQIKPNGIMVLQQLPIIGWQDGVNIRDISACEDGSLLVVHENEKIYFYRADYNGPGGNWSRNEKGECFTAFKRPVDGFTTFDYLFKSAIPRLITHSDDVYKRG